MFLDINRVLFLSKIPARLYFYIYILDENRTMDIVHKNNICTNVPSSQTFITYL
jgi:hypothetical protein